MDDKRLDILADKWTSDQTFRHALRADPQRAIADLGIALDEDELAALKSMDISRLSDTELEERISRSAGGGGGC